MFLNPNENDPDSDSRQENILYYVYGGRYVNYSYNSSLEIREKFFFRAIVD